MFSEKEVLIVAEKHQENEGEYVAIVACGKAITSTYQLPPFFPGSDQSGKSINLHRGPVKRQYV